METLEVLDEKSHKYYGDVSAKLFISHLQMALE